MRISLLTYSTKPRGGVVHTLNLAEALAAEGADVTVWSLARGGDNAFFRAVDPAVALRLVPFVDRDGESVADRIVRSIEVLGSNFDHAGADIVHAQDCISANAAGRCIRTIHHLEQFTTPVLAQCHDRAIVEPYAHICVSAAVAREVCEGWGLAPTVIANGVHAERFIAASAEETEPRRLRAEWRRRLGTYILAVGGIEPRKGSIDLLDAYSLVLRRYPETALVFAGGETLFDYRDYRSAFDARLADLRITPNILGPVADGDLPSLVAASTVFAFPSTKEGFGLAAMEALAASRPVVARDLPVLREVFGDTVSYARTPPELAAGICDALTPDPRRAHAGRRLATSFRWADAAKAHLDFYARSGW
jgi:glycosyltransferase-like protein